MPDAPAPVQTFGLEETAFWRASDIQYGERGTRFNLLRDGEALGAFELPLIGEYNIRNALAALATAAHTGLAPDRLQPALPALPGSSAAKKKSAASAIFSSSTTLPTTPPPLPKPSPDWRAPIPTDGFFIAVFEPASATNARALFEDRYVDAFAPATAIVVAKVPRAERARSDELFSPARLVDRLAATGKTARYIPDTEAIADHLANAARPGDLIAFLSNGGFGGLQRKLLARLENAT